MRRLKLLVVALVAVLGIGLTLAPVPVLAEDTTAQDNMKEFCDRNSGSSVCQDLDDNDPEGSVSNIFRNIINVLLFIVGIVAIIMIIVSGLKFSASHGDSNAAAKARQTLIQAVVGLIIAVAAFAIVNFVISQLNNSSGGSSGGGTSCPDGQSWNGTTKQCE